MAIRPYEKCDKAPRCSAGVFVGRWLIARLGAVLSFWKSIVGRLSKGVVRGRLGARLGAVAVALSPPALEALANAWLVTLFAREIVHGVSSLCQQTASRGDEVRVRLG